MKKAIERVSQLSEAEQEVYAAWLLADLDTDNAFDRALSQPCKKLLDMADEALEEFCAGKTLPLDPEKM